VTTIDAAAAWRAKRTIALAALITGVAIGLAGCSSSGVTIGDSGPSLVEPGQAPAATPQPARIAIAPVIGAPDAVSKQLQSQLTAALESKNIGVAKSTSEKVEYTLRGYVVSAREKAGTKVSYIWDVTDPAGKRVNRVTGEETIAGAQGKDPWSSVTPQIVDQIANKTAGQLATWMPQPNHAAIASGAPATPANSTASPTSPAQNQVAAATPSPAPSASNSATTTGSIGAVTALVPSVTGAPGDGSVSLTSAIQRELSRNGVSLTEQGSPQTYRVEGKVAVGAGKDGKQPIQIDWHVKDPQGKKLGTVSQKNEIPQGSLDGAWGKTADAAAAAAAQGILKLLPQPKSVN